MVNEWSICKQPRAKVWASENGGWMMCFGSLFCGIGMVVGADISTNAHSWRLDHLIETGRERKRRNWGKLERIKWLPGPPVKFYDSDEGIYEIFSRGAALAENLSPGKSLRFDTPTGPAYVWDAEVFFVAFAEVCKWHGRYSEASLLREAIGYLEEADKRRSPLNKNKYGLWARDSELFKEITKSLQETEELHLEAQRRESEIKHPVATTASSSKELQATRASKVSPIAANNQSTDLTALGPVLTAGGHITNFGKVLGEGASGVVYQGTWNQQEVAIKRFHATQLRGNELREFLKEASFMMDLQSDYLVKMHDVVAQSSYFCMVMEYMPNGSLYQVLGSDMDLSWDKRWVIAMDIAHGVAALHSKDIVHRDIKSLNVLIGHGFRAKLADFGQAKLKTSSQSVKSRRAESGAVGTVAWLAPEILREGVECSKETDMYSFGMTLWELGTKQTPFANAPNVTAMTHWISQGKCEDLSKIPQPKLAHLVRWCWERNPQARPSAQKAIEAIDEATPKYVSQAVPRPTLFSN